MFHVKQYLEQLSTKKWGEMEWIDRIIIIAICLIFAIACCYDGGYR